MYPHRAAFPSRPKPVMQALEGPQGEVWPFKRFPVCGDAFPWHPCPAGFRQKGLDNMKQISTGAGLVALSVGMVATAFIATHRSGSEAFAQGTGSERRIVSASVIPYQVGSSNSSCLIATRIWSDNVVEARALGTVSFTNGSALLVAWRTSSGFDADLGASVWRTLDNGTSGFRPLTDVDMSGETDAGDISQVLLDFNTRSEDLPPPPIDCNINAPR